jgi:hypothetical protein
VTPRTSRTKVSGTHKVFNLDRLTVLQKCPNNVRPLRDSECPHFEVCRTLLSSDLCCFGEHAPNEALNRDEFSINGAKHEKSSIYHPASSIFSVEADVVERRTRLSTRMKRMLYEHSTLRSPRAFQISRLAYGGDSMNGIPLYHEAGTRKR